MRASQPRVPRRRRRRHRHRRRHRRRRCCCCCCCCLCSIAWSRWRWRRCQRRRWRQRWRMAAVAGWRRRRRWGRRRRRRPMSLRPPPSGRSRRCCRAAEKSRCAAPLLSPLPEPVMRPTPTPVAPRRRLVSWVYAGTWAFAPPHSNGSLPSGGCCPAQANRRASCLVAESGQGLPPRAAARQAPLRLRAPSGCEEKGAALATSASRGRRPEVVAAVAVAWCGRRAVHS